MPRHFPHRLRAAVLLVSASLIVSSVRANHIDTFNDATSFFVRPIPTPSSEPSSTPSTPASLTQTAADGIDPAVTLGGERFIQVSGGSYIVPNAQKYSQQGVMDFRVPITTNANPSFSTLLFDYGRTTPLSDGAGGIDFGTLWDNVTVNVLSAGNNPVPPSGRLKVVIESGGHAGGTIASGSASQLVQRSGAFGFYFDDPGYSGVDFTDVTQVTVLLEYPTTYGGFYVIDGIFRASNIPEPASLALSLLAFGGVALRWRQR